MAFQEAHAGASSVPPVAIPRGLHACLDSFCGSLKLRLLEGAIHHATVRKVRSDRLMVTDKDVAYSAREVFQNAACDLEQAMRQHEIANERRNAS